MWEVAFECIVVYVSLEMTYSEKVTVFMVCNGLNYAYTLIPLFCQSDLCLLDAPDL